MTDRDSGRYIVALEIGSSKIRGAIGWATPRSASSPSGAVDVIAVAEEKLIDKVRYGCIQNMEVCNALTRVVETLEGHPQIAPRQITGAYVALGGRTLWSSTADVSVDLGQETEITEPIINDLCRQAESTVSSDRDAVDVVPVRFTVDNKTQNHPIGSFGRTVGARMTVLSCAPQLKKMLRRVLEDRMGLTIIDYIPRVLAEADLTLTDGERRLGCLFVDLGAETTSLAIYKNGNPVYVTTLPMGSRNITMDLTTLNCLEERAEEIKKAIGNALIHEAAGAGHVADGVDYSDVNNYIHSRADEIIANILAQVEFAGMKLEDLGGDIVVVGGGARLRGFTELLSQQSNLKVRMGTIPASVRFADASLNAGGAIDVISVLAEANIGTPEECLSELPQEEEEPQEEPAANNYDELLKRAGDQLSGNVRIGRDGDDDPEPDTPEVQEEKPARPAKRGGLSALFGKFRDRMSALAEDPEDE